MKKIVFFLLFSLMSQVNAQSSWYRINLGSLAQPTCIFMEDETPVQMFTRINKDGLLNLIWLDESKSKGFIANQLGAILVIHSSYSECNRFRIQSENDVDLASKIAAEVANVLEKESRMAKWWWIRVTYSNGSAAIGGYDHSFGFECFSVSGSLDNEVAKLNGSNNQYKLTWLKDEKDYAMIVSKYDAKLYVLNDYNTCRNLDRNVEVNEALSKEFARLRAK